ncbi:MAG TPA: poly(R)-hydroxyalkanoic acid synthase subunit PhaE [Thermohalobaculum sp.]|nr:poly(R)-hydroxyalkanoic acid synthase subunit PhaE [Thermohalobaculum sp.]
MSDRGTADQDLFQIWLASSRAFFAADPSNSLIAESLKEKCAALFAAWNRFAQTYAEASSTGAQGGPFDPVGWLDAAGSSGFGDLWRWFGAADGTDLWREERDALTASRQWIAYATALERYRTVIGAAWLKAFKRFTEEMAQDYGQPGPTSDGLPGWEVIQTRWQRAASAELAMAQRSDEFLAAQRDLIRTRLDCSAFLRGRIGRIAEMLGLPTRAEVDDLHQTIHGLKRDLRALHTRLDDGK